MTEADEKQTLQRYLRNARGVLLWKLEGLSDYDIRRPMTPTGTNLLGLVKHLAALEYGYLGESFGYPAPESMSWIEDGSIWQGADMWAKPDESSEYITVPKYPHSTPAQCLTRPSRFVPVGVIGRRMS